MAQININLEYHTENSNNTRIFSNGVLSYEGKYMIYTNNMGKTTKFKLQDNTNKSNQYLCLYTGVFNFDEEKLDKFYTDFILKFYFIDITVGYNKIIIGYKSSILILDSFTLKLLKTIEINESYNYFLNLYDDNKILFCESNHIDIWNIELGVKTKKIDLENNILYLKIYNKNIYYIDVHHNINKYDMTDDMIDDMTDDITDDMTNDITNDMIDDIKNDMTNDMIDDIKNDITDNIKNDIKNDITDNKEFKIIKNTRAYTLYFIYDYIIIYDYVTHNIRIFDLNGNEFDNDFCKVNNIISIYVGNNFIFTQSEYHLSKWSVEYFDIK
jgi:hypothetical protein